MSLIANAVNPADIKDEFSGLIDELAATEFKTAELTPIPSADWPVTIRKIRTAAANAGHGVKVYTKVEVTVDGVVNLLVTIGLIAPVVRAKSTKPKAPRKPSTDGPGNAVDVTD